MCDNGRRYKIVTWNINQASNRYGRNKIPELIIKELVRQNPDVLVLTEFAFGDGANEFLDNLTKRHYTFFPREATENTKNKQNEVLVVWREELFECKRENSTSEIVTNVNNRPNFVKVCLLDKQTKKEIVVAGVRITMAKWIPKNLSKIEMQKAYHEQAIMRRKQMEYIYYSLEDFSTVIIMGDFNNYRRGTNIQDWNINELTCNRSEYCRYTPTGQSIYNENQGDTEYQFAEDHFITKGCSIKDYVYDRSFVNWDKQVYSRGSDFDNYDWEGLIGYPDHAVLYGDLYL